MNFDKIEEFNNKDLLLNLIKGHTDLKLLDNDNIFSIRANYFKGNVDKNMVDIYKREAEIFFVDRGVNGDSIEQSVVFQWYNALKFYLLDVNAVCTLFAQVNEISHAYHFYKKYDYQEHFKMFDTIFNYKNKRMARSITLKIPYDTVAALSTGRGSSQSGSTIIDKMYLINPDASISELIDIHFPTKTTNKISVRLINLNGIHTFYYSLRKDDDYTLATAAEFEAVIKQEFFERYQSAVKKHLNIKNAEYNPDYVTLLHMIKI